MPGGSPASSLGWLISRVAARIEGELKWWFAGDAASTITLDFTRKDASAINREFLNWLSSHDERPFFAFLNYFDCARSLSHTRRCQYAVRSRPEIVR